MTLARSGRVRAVVADLPQEGAAVRDDTGRTYLAATVEKGPLALPAPAPRRRVARWPAARAGSRRRPW